MAVLRAVAPTFTRPNDATPYSSGDLVANNTAAGSVVALAFKFFFLGPQRSMSIRSGIITANGTGVTNKALRLHLFSATPTFTSAGDNSAISTVGVGFANWIGALDVTAMTALSDGSFGVGAALAGSEILFQAPGPASDGSSTLFGFLEARGAYTPTAQETFSVAINGYDLTSEHG